MKTIKEFLKDYLNFWDKRTHDKNGNRICKYPFAHWVITALVVSSITIIISIHSSKLDGRTTPKSIFYAGNVSQWCFLQYYTVGG